MTKHVVPKWVQDIFWHLEHAFSLYNSLFNQFACDGDLIRGSSKRLMADDEIQLRRFAARYWFYLSITQDAHGVSTIIWPSSMTKTIIRSRGIELIEDSFPEFSKEQVEQRLMTY